MFVLESYARYIRMGYDAVSMGYVVHKVPWPVFERNRAVIPEANLVTSLCNCHVINNMMLSFVDIDDCCVINKSLPISYHVRAIFQFFVCMKQ